jgi:hypothetical protein
LPRRKKMTRTALKLKMVKKKKARKRRMTNNLTCSLLEAAA